MPEYMSISEFASHAGVSKQAIYKQVGNQNSQLYPYVVHQGKKTSILVKALAEVYGVEQPKATYSTAEVDKESTFTTPQATQAEADLGQSPAPAFKIQSTKTTPDNPDSQPISTDYISFLKAQIETLQEEKKDLSKAIQDKDQIIRQQSDQLSELASQVAAIAHKALVTTSQQQYLTAAATAEKAQDKAQDKEPHIVSQDSAPERDAAYSVVPEPDKPKHKQGLFQKFFKR